MTICPPARVSVMMRTVMLVTVGMIASMVITPCLGVGLAAKHKNPDYRKSEKNLHHSLSPVF
jgi:hypothetical protein